MQLLPGPRRKYRFDRLRDVLLEAGARRVGVGDLFEAAAEQLEVDGAALHLARPHGVSTLRWTMEEAPVDLGRSREPEMLALDYGIDERRVAITVRPTDGEPRPGRVSPSTSGRATPAVS